MDNWQYVGDIDLSYGGVFFRIDDIEWKEHGYCDALRVTPCSDAGLQSNAYWIEALTVLRWRDNHERSSILGNYEEEPDTALWEAEACLSYGLYDPAIYYPDTNNETVQVGKADPFHSGETIKVDRYLKEGTNLVGYVKAVWLARL